MTVLWQGFVLGLSSGTFCLISCAPAIVPTLLLEERAGRWAAWGQLLQFMGGRLLAYLLVGLAGGYVGMRWGAGLPAWVFGWAWIVMAALFIGQVLLQWRRRAGGGWGASLWRRLPPTLPGLAVLLGLLVGLRPCLPLWLALTTVLERGRPLEGLLLFAAFFVATSLFLLPLGLLGRLSRHPAVRQVARWTALLVGVGFFLMGLGQLLA